MRRLWPAHLDKGRGADLKVKSLALHPTRIFGGFHLPGEGIDAGLGVGSGCRGDSQLDPGLTTRLQGDCLLREKKPLRWHAADSDQEGGRNVTAVLDGEVVAHGLPQPGPPAGCNFALFSQRHRGKESLLWIRVVRANRLPWSGPLAPSLPLDQYQFVFANAQPLPLGEGPFHVEIPVVSQCSVVVGARPKIQ